MGDMLGQIAGIAGGLMGGMSANNAANKAAGASLTGFNYLQNSPYAQQYLQSGGQALQGQGNVQNALAGLLGVGGNPAQAAAAFNNYKASTGYNFQLGQGTKAINTNAATSGLLQSGANAKALTGFGQNLAATTFNNYLSQLGGLNSAYGGTAGMGENMLGQIGQAGTVGGGNAANAYLQGGQAQSNMWGGLGGALGNMFGGGAAGAAGGGGGGNFLGGLFGGNTFGAVRPTGAPAAVALGGGGGGGGNFTF